MISLDSNVLVRLLVDDSGEPEQVRVARDQAKRAGTVFVAQIVQVETVWVLETSYTFNKKAIISILEHLSSNSCFELERENIYQAALQMYSSGKADFSEYLILAASQKKECPVVTFDKRLGKSSRVRLLTCKNR